MTPSKSLVNYSFWVLCIVGFFAILSSTMSKNPVLNPFARALETPDSLLGFVAAASTIPGILVSLPAGALSDIFGRRKILLASSAVFASAPFLYLFVTSWWQLALVRFYHGFATAMFVPVANAFVAELFPTKRGERISLFSSATVVGRTIAPFLGGYILFVTDYGFHELYLAVGIFGLAAFVTVLLLLKDNSQTSNKSRENQSREESGFFRGWIAVARNRDVLIASLVEAAQYYAFGAVEFFLVGYLMEIAQLDPLSFGIIMGAQLAIIPLIKPFMGRLSDRIGRRTPIIAGSLISAFALAAVSSFVQFPILLLISITYGVGFSLVTSSTPALVSELTQDKLVGTSMGFLSTIMDVGQTLGPIITGFILATNLGYFGSFSMITAILLATCLLFALTKVAKSKKKEPK